MNLAKRFLDYLCHRYVSIRLICESFLDLRDYPKLFLGLGFVMSVTDHFFMTCLIGLSLVVLFGAWAPVRHFVYEKTNAQPTPFSDLMIWAFLVSCLAGLWTLLFLDLSRRLHLYLGLLIVVGYGFQGFLSVDTSLKFRNVGYGLKLGSILCLIGFIRVVGHYFLGIFSILSGILLMIALYDWVLRYMASSREPVDG